MDLRINIDDYREGNFSVMRGRSQIANVYEVIAGKKVMVVCSFQMLELKRRNEQNSGKKRVKEINFRSREVFLM